MKRGMTLSSLCHFVQSLLIIVLIFSDTQGYISYISGIYSQNIQQIAFQSNQFVPSNIYGQTGTVVCIRYVVYQTRYIHRWEGTRDTAVHCSQIWSVYSPYRFCSLLMNLSIPLMFNKRIPSYRSLVGQYILAMTTGHCL